MELFPGHTLDPAPCRVLLLPYTGPSAPPRPRWWRHPIRAWRVRDLPDPITSRFRLRIEDTSGQPIIDADDYSLRLILLYGRQSS